MTRPVPLLALFALLTVLARMTLPTHALTCDLESQWVYGGTCVEYHGVCAKFVGNKVFLGTGATIDNVEQQVKLMLLPARQAGPLVSDACNLAIDRFHCNNAYPRCTDPVPPQTEALPILGCQSYCEAFWVTCATSLQQYLQYKLIPEGGGYNSSSTPFCGTGHFSGIGNPPSDTYGGRVLPSWYFQPIWGYRGQLRYPDGFGVYTLMDNVTTVNVACDTPLTASGLIDLPNDCIYPLQPFPQANGETVCALGCPFPLLAGSETSAIQLCFTVPGIIGFVLCLYVFLDALVTVWDASVARGGRVARCAERLPKLWIGTWGPSSTREDSAQSGVNTSHHKGGGGGLGSSSRDVMSSTAHSPRAAANSINSPPPASSTTFRRTRRSIRATTIYALVGGALGIVYFALGPAAVLARGTQISCASNENASSITVQDLLGGTADRSESSCKAMRATPFILQMQFNLIFYAMAKVVLMVSQRAKRWVNANAARKRGVEAALIFYCAGLPIICLAVAMAIEKIAVDVNSSFIALARQSAVCQVRLDPSAEVVLVFLPFILTGVLIVIITFYAYLSLSRHVNAVKELRGEGGGGSTPAPSSPNHGSRGAGTGATAGDRALIDFIRRLAWLGIFTFVTLVVLMASTGYIFGTLANFAPAFSSWFSCAVDGRACFRCDTMWPAVTDNKPDPAAFAVQSFSMSFVPVLFGAFFGAAPLERLYRRIRDGRCCCATRSNTRIVDGATGEGAASGNQGSTKAVAGTSAGGGMVSVGVGGEEM